MRQKYQDRPWSLWKRNRNRRSHQDDQKDKEITGAMVALGGSIAVYGEKSDGSDWNVGSKIQTAKTEKS